MITNTHSSNSPFPSDGLGIEMFGKAFRLFWFALAAVTIVAEVAPAAGLEPWIFYTYKGSKVVLFFLFGYCTPLSFHRFDKLLRGLLLAMGSALLVEILQLKIGNGHRFSFVELVAKFALISLGFVFALEARYERAIIIGKWRFRFTGEHTLDGET
jgi:hypothetical protein